MKKASLLIVSDHQMLLEYLESALGKQAAFAEIETAASSTDAMNKVRDRDLDLLLVDVSLPGASALELTRQIRAEMPDIKIIILGLTGSEPVVLEYIEAGANGYILKEESVDDLISVIDSVFSGETVCSPRIAYFTFLRLADRARKRRNIQVLGSLNLTPREIEILRLIVAELSNKQIAQELHLSLHTVKNHVHNILERLQVKHRADAVHYALSIGLFR